MRFLLMVSRRSEEGRKEVGDDDAGLLGLKGW